MGTNYYLRFNTCPNCDRANELHIGKSSGGWRFSFRGYIDSFDVEELIPDKLPIKNIQDWRRVIDREDCRIFDEYETEHTKESFYSLITQKSGLQSHAAYVHQNAIKYPEYLDDNWHDDWGNSFTSTEFS
ncbi:MAG: hypothetical protein AAFQ41_00405 [Cyanobacteria bacterium J06623_7]